MKRVVESKKNKIIIAAVLLSAIIGGSIYAYFSSSTRSTENAYISADVTSVAAQVSGKVSAVYATENQYVHKGEALFDIDTAPFVIALSRAQADLAVAQQSARQDNAEINVARAQIAQTESDLANARASYERNKKLVEQNFLTRQSAD